FGQNLVNLMKLVTPEKDGQAVLDMDDTVVRGMTVAQAGETLWPPPPVQVSAAPAAAPAGGATPVADKPVKKPMSQQRRFGLIVGLGLLFVLLSAWMPGAILGNFLIFMLSVVIGFYVIGNVH
ncbi:MAG: NAD(P)(+) transhydrogenase (Re/Si-specific) subunit alpha, partial [Tetrasphaera sp.]|nr:NAD(P)(+) transhydrogenase (Re/Si-specific) subunit alpha [Tetrasphaera sp.]